MKAPSCRVLTKSGSVYTLAYGDPKAQDKCGVTLRRHNPAADYILSRNGEVIGSSTEELMLDRVYHVEAPIVGEKMEIQGERNGKAVVVTTNVVIAYEEDGDFFL